MISERGIQPERLAQAINEIFIATFGNDVYEENIVECREVANKLVKIVL